MKILAADTSTNIASVALADGPAILAEYTVEVTNMHTARLIPLIDELLWSAGCSLEELDALCVGLGPGSFTGVRIGVSTLKSMSYALQKPLVGVCTLDALAFGLRQAGTPICAMLDARRREVYAAVYHSPPTRDSDILCVSMHELVEQLPEPTLLVGSGADVYREQLEELAGERIHFAEPVFGVPRAALLTQIALSRVVDGTTDDFMAITPIYVRKPEAEVQYESGRLGSKKLI